MSATASLPEVRRRNPALRILYYAVCLLLVALIAGVWWLYWIARSPLPQLDGSVSVPGISSKVRVVRDEHGVPTIEAATLDDLFFAQGYVTAQDRLWQMDMMRRAAAGELSEVIGEDTVKMDREQRILGLRVAAEAAEKSIPLRARPGLFRGLRSRRECVSRIASRPAFARIPPAEVHAAALDGDRFPAGGRAPGAGSEPLQLRACADAGKNSGETGTGADRGPVREFFVAGPSADRSAADGRRTRGRQQR